MASLSSLPGISGENSRLRNGIIGVGYVFLLLMVIGAVSPAEDTDSSSSTPTETPAATDTPADTEQNTGKDTPTATQAPDTETDSSSGSSDSSDSSGSSDSSDSSDSSGYQVRISYGGEWQGSLGAGGSSRSVDGSGTETFDIEKNNPFVVSANAQKRDSGSGELTVAILKDGEVVSEQSTSAEYGMAQTTT